jgi:hypothetical protein
MMLSEIIGRMQYLLSAHGDQEVLSQDMYPIMSIDHEVSDGSFDESWNLPAGAEYIQITDIR